MSASHTLYVAPTERRNAGVPETYGASSRGEFQPRSQVPACFETGLVVFPLRAALRIKSRRTCIKRRVASRLCILSSVWLRSPDAIAWTQVESPRVLKNFVLMVAPLPVDRPPRPPCVLVWLVRTPGALRGRVRRIRTSLNCVAEFQVWSPRK